MTSLARKALKALVLSPVRDPVLMPVSLDSVDSLGAPHSHLLGPVAPSPAAAAAAAAAHSHRQILRKYSSRYLVLCVMTVLTLS